MMPRWQWIAIAAAILGAVAIMGATSSNSYWHHFFAGDCFKHYCHRNEAMSSQR